MIRNLFLPASLMASAIIGAGMFSLPYVFSQVNLIVGIFYLAVMTIFVTIVHWCYADVILRTSGEHNFVGYAKIYLGEGAARLAVLMVVVQMLMVLAIYLTVAANFINLLFGWDGYLWPVVIFWALASVMIFTGLKKLAKIDFFVLAVIVTVIFVIFILAWRAGLAQFFLRVKFQDFIVRDYWLLLIGPILFALSGRVGVSEVVKYFAPEKPLVKIRRAVILGTVFSAITYLLFILGVIFWAHPLTPDSLTSLVGKVPLILLFLLALFSLLKIWTSYIAVAFDVRWNLMSDLHWQSTTAGTMIVLLPLLIYFWSVANVIFLTSLVGGVFIVLESVFIFLMRARLK